MLLEDLPLTNNYSSLRSMIAAFVLNTLFTKALFWIGVYSLPMGMLTPTLAECVGLIIARYIHFEDGDQGLSSGSFLCIRVGIAVFKPLEQFVLFTGLDGKT